MQQRRLTIVLFLLVFSTCIQAQEWQWSVAVTGGKTKPGTRAWLWIPSSCKRIKAVVVAQNNMEELSILENTAFRRTLSDLDIAEVWVSPPFDHVFNWTDGAGEVFNRLIGDLADSSGYVELRNDPVIGIGHSAAASWPYFFAAWAPERTLACISVSGQWPYFRHPQFAPDIWAKDQNIDYIPLLETMGEYEAAATWSTEGLKERQAHPAMPLSMLACPAESHFAASQKKIDYIAFYIRKAIQYRLPDYDPLQGPPHLKKIDPTHTGWLMDKWRYNQLPTVAAAPVGKYKGDATQAFWSFDEETVRRTEKYEADYRNMPAPLLAYLQDGKAVQQKNTHLQVELHWLPQADGITFSLRPAFLDTVPGESPRPAMWTGLPVGAAVSHPRDPSVIRIERVCGPFEKINDTTFRLSLEKESLPGHRQTLTFVAVYPGDGHYKPAIQQAEVPVPAGYTEGREQHIDFPAIADVPAGSGGLSLKATSDAGLPVAFYVLEGPAELRGDKLRFTRLPPRSHYPVKVTVVAWQYGRTGEPKVRTADPVVRSFYLRETR